MTYGVLLFQWKSMSPKSLLLFAVLLVLFFTLADTNNPCIRRDFGRSSFVCVCNATYCDNPPNVHLVNAGQAVLISSTRLNDRFQIQNLSFTSDGLSNTLIADDIFIDASVKYQTILGFGGAFTDAAGINIGKLSVLAQAQVIKAYYSEEGIEYNIGRVPMGGTDFSIRAYTYDDFPGDVHLSNFSLAKEDLFYKIPYINWAHEFSSKPIKLFASPWSAPAWMKSNNDLIGKGYLLLENYQIWADYFVRFFEEYKKHNLTFWGLTAQNEPLNGNVENFSFNCMGWNAENQSLFIGLNLGPTLEAKGFGDIKIMTMDDQRLQLPKWAKTVLSHPEANKYVSGIGVHWYVNFLSPPSALTATHNYFPDRFILATEACEGDKPWQKEKVILGSWERLESYAHDIIENLNHWVIGWVDWNLVLNEQGGPNWTNNFVDAPILVNSSKDEFYKQPMYYAMGHFSKYIPENSVRISIVNSDETKLFSTAVLRPDGKKVVVILNRSDDEKLIRLTDADSGTLEFSIPSRSIHTLVYT